MISILLNNKIGITIKKKKKNIFKYNLQFQSVAKKVAEALL